MVVIELPPILEAAEAQVLAAAADRVVLILERGVTLGPDALKARKILEGVGATIAGVIVVDPDAASPRTVEMLEAIHVDEPRSVEAVGNAEADHDGPGSATDDGPAANGVVTVTAVMNGAVGNGAVTNGAVPQEDQATDGAVGEGEAVGNGAVPEEDQATDGAVGEGEAVGNGAVPEEDQATDGAAISRAVAAAPSVEGADLEGRGAAGVEADGTTADEAPEEDRIDEPDTPSSETVSDRRTAAVVASAQDLRTS